MGLIYAVLIFVGTPLAGWVTVRVLVDRVGPSIGTGLTIALAAGLFLLGPFLAETVLLHLPPVFAIWGIGVWLGLLLGAALLIGDDGTSRPTAHAHGDLWHDHAHEGLHYHPHGEHDTTHVLTKEGT